MSATSGSATLPSFVAEIERLSDEMELFGFPRLLPPELMPDAYPNGKMEMEAVKVLDLLHTLMDALWAMVQARRRDRELSGDEGDAAAGLARQLKTMESDYQRLQTRAKKKSREVSALASECVALKSSREELAARLSAHEETVRSLRSQLKHLRRSTTVKTAARDIEIVRLKERGGRAHRSPCARTKPVDVIKASQAKETRLKEAILHYQRTTEVLVEENLTLQHRQGAGEGTGDGAHTMKL